MPTIVSCRCGRRFAAREHLLGKQLPCPGCGQMLVVTPAETQGVYVACACGRAFMARESMRGRQTNCPGCKRPIQVPKRTIPEATAPSSEDPLGLGEFSPHDPTLMPLPGSGDAEIPWHTLKEIGRWGGGVLALVILGMSAMNYIRWAMEAEERSAAVAPAAKTTLKAAPSPGSASSGKLLPGSTPTESTKSVEPDASLSSPAASASGVERLPYGMKDWYAQPAEKIKPVPRSKPDDSATTQFSWLTALLPFLGRMDVYEKFDFNEPLTKGKNLQTAGTLVPEFLNPLDDQQRWQGYPFNGMALTHFVGISGVENRNLVAAKLPRTDPRAGVFGYDEIARPEYIKDGQSQTAMVAGAGALPNPWVFGGGATIRGAREPLFGATSGLGTKGVPGGGSVIVLADGSVRHVSGSVDPKVFRAMCTINGSDSVDLENGSQAFSMDQLKKP